MSRLRRRAFPAELKKQAVAAPDRLQTGAGPKKEQHPEAPLCKKDHDAEGLGASNGTVEDAKFSHKSVKEDGVMVALMLTPNMAEKLAVKGGEPPESLHLTLAYLGQKDEMPEDFETRLSAAMRKASAGVDKITGVIRGVGRFSAEDTTQGRDVVYAEFDSSEFSEFRKRLVEELKAEGLPVHNDQGFIPHVTLAYVGGEDPSPVESVPHVGFSFKSATLMVGDRVRNRFYFNGAIQKDVSDESNNSVDTKIRVPLCKVHEEKRLVTGIVLEPDEVDAHNDTISSEEIENAAYEFLYAFNKQTQLGVMHTMFGDIGVKLAESWIARRDDEMGGQKVKKGSWLITVKVEDDKLWSRIKSGQVTGFSIGGTAKVI